MESVDPRPKTSGVCLVGSVTKGDCLLGFLNALRHQISPEGRATWAADGAWGHGPTGLVVQLTNGHVDAAEADWAKDSISLTWSAAVLASHKLERVGRHGDQEGRARCHLHSPALAKPKPVIAINLTRRARADVEVRLGSLRSLGQKGATTGPCTGRISRMKGCASGPPTRLGQG